MLPLSHAGVERQLRKSTMGISHIGCLSVGVASRESTAPEQKHEMLVNALSPKPHITHTLIIKQP